MTRSFTRIQKCAFGFALLFLFVYSLDYVPGIMDSNGKMFGLFSMTTFVDIGHLGLGLLALISGFVGPPHVSTSGFWGSFTRRTSSTTSSAICTSSHPSPTCW